MDYEKLKEAKRLYKTANQDQKYVLESLFPELAESRDERIRKDLIRFVKGYIPDETSEQRKAYLSWLEKQGEPKILGVGVENASGVLKECIDKIEQKSFDYENANIQQKDFAPQEEIPRYSICDVLCDKSCTTLNKESQPNFEIIDIRNGMYICDKCSFPISQQDEYELVAKRIEQNLAWSEEDENICCTIINDIANDKSMCKYEISKRLCDTQINWLKSLKWRLKGE